MDDIERYFARMCSDDPAWEEGQRALREYRRARSVRRLALFLLYCVMLPLLGMQIASTFAVLTGAAHGSPILGVIAVAAVSAGTLRLSVALHGQWWLRLRGRR